MRTVRHSVQDQRMSVQPSIKRQMGKSAAARRHKLLEYWVDIFEAWQGKRIIKLYLSGYVLCMIASTTTLSSSFMLI